MKVRHLEALGMGEYTYDYDNDMLLFKIKDRDYLKSIDFDNIIVDVDVEGFVTGLRILDATKVLGLSKIALKNVKQFRFDTIVENNVITIHLRFVSVMRNKPVITQGHDFVREALHSQLSNSEVVCTVT